MSDNLHIFISEIADDISIEFGLVNYTKSCQVHLILVCISKVQTMLHV
jgi:hypothetical protein